MTYLMFQRMYLRGLFLKFRKIFKLSFWKLIFLLFKDSWNIVRALKAPKSKYIAYEVDYVRASVCLNKQQKCVHLAEWFSKTGNVLHLRST